MDTRLTVIYRLEPGCLGPDGSDHIVIFCQLMQKALANKPHQHVIWQVIPRFDKTVDEIQYTLANKILTRQQASVLLSTSGCHLDEIIDQFEDNLTHFINHYIARK